MRMDNQGLACVVLGLGNPPELAGAVRSLVEQRRRPEVVVVNSGGGDAAGSLRAAGLDVRVVSFERRLLPGAARNAGIAATSSPFVAFLAADCIATPGWVEARLRLHRAGAPVVAHVLGNATPASRSACAQHLLLHHRLLRDTPERQRLFFGLSYARELFDRHGLFREDLPTYEDTELNGRLAAAGVPMVHAADARTLHRYVTGPAGLLRDQYARGVDAASVARQLGHPLSASRLARIPLKNVLPAIRQAARTTDPAERARLMRGVPLVPAGALAVSLGNLAGGMR
jgi:glycosyltransferase involved in cell wall biosynthesis